MDNTEMQGEMVTDEMLINRIYVIRGQKVMIDTDLAALYEVEAGWLKKLIARNINRFPLDFMFSLDLEDYHSLKLQDSSVARKTLARYFPKALTEQGLAMLAGLLKTERSISINIRIIRIFTLIRQVLPDYPEMRKEMEQFKSHLTILP